MKKILPLFLLAGLLAAGLAASPAAYAKNPVPAAKSAKASAPAAAGKAATPAAAANAAGTTTAPAAAPVAGADTKLCTEVPEPPQQHWPHKDLFGTYDMAAVQRGFQVYREVCSSCHSLKFMSYRDLEGIGYTPAQVKAFAAQFTVPGAPDDSGQVADRPAISADHFKSPFPNEQAARASNNGALPPDMSLLVKAREHGEDYIFALLNGFETPPPCASMMNGMNWNKYFPPHQIAMPKPLSDGQVSFADGTSGSTEQEARDVVQFLAYASEPHLEQRKALGFKVLLFMLVFAGIMWKAKGKVWADVK